MKKDSKNLILFLFLLGIFMGAMDTGIVSPARTVIAASFNISTEVSVWMITVYTLSYAVSMPITGKLSDMYGKKKVYMISILIFGIGSLLCGVSDMVGSYEFLIVSRVIEAVGAGGIMPIATAYIGESFPINKRGTALGLVGAVYGIATVLGPSLGSGIIDIFGAQKWGLLFLINVPLCIIVILLATLVKDESTIKPKAKMDLCGSIVLSLLIISIMYALTNLNFGNLKASLTSLHVYPFLIAFIILIFIFIMVERKASEPVLNLNYFKDKDIVLTLILSFIVGCAMMALIFIPQLGANVLRLKTGSGGYLVTLMAIFTGIAAPLGGKIIDKFSVKSVLTVGFCSTIIGSLILSLITTKTCDHISLYIGLIILGLGMGFTMGTPINYLIQGYVKKDDASSGQATVSLIRSIGVAISPNLLVNFLSDAGKKLPTALMNVMPPINIPGINLTESTGHMSVNMANSFQNAGVDNIVSVVKDFMQSMIHQMSPMIEKSLSGKIPPNTSPEAVISTFTNNYLASIDKSKSIIESTFQKVLNSGFSDLFICVAILALIGLVLTQFLSSKRLENLKHEK